MKTCPTCRVVMPSEAFHKSRSAKDGLCFACKACSRVKAKKWYLKNREKVKARARAWESASPVRQEQALERARVWRENNKERQRENIRLWAIENRLRRNTNEANRRARKSGRVYFEEIADLVSSYGGLCVYCMAPYEHLDHVEPLSMGGMHSISNLVPACAPCNLSKNNKPMLVWLATRQPTLQKEMV